MKPKDQALEIWGDLACFTRPELKVERFSYPIITPSAARGIFDAIYCKPKEFRWQITKIEILSSVNYIALRRNEVKEKIKISASAINMYENGTKEIDPIFADSPKSRTQRQTIALKDTRYIIHGEIRPWPDFGNRQQGLEAQFRRRAKQGKCIYQPYMGCREFPAYFELIEPDEMKYATKSPEIEDIGWMVYDVFDLSKPGDEYSPPFISLYEPKIQDGVIDVPDYESDLVHKPLSGGE